MKLTQCLICNVVIGVMAVGCSSQPTQPTDIPEVSAQARMNRVLQDMTRGDYEAATEEFGHLLVQKPASEFDLIAMYNDGSAYVLLDDCKRGAELFRHTVHAASALKIKRVEAESLYQLAQAYECMGNDRRTIAALLDAHHLQTYLRPEIGQAELPARLAAAYARIGQRDKA